MKKITGKFPHFSCFFPPFLQVKSPRPSLCTSRCLWTSLQDKTASTNCLSQRNWLGSNPGKICPLNFSFQKFFTDVRMPDSDPIGLSSIIPSLSSLVVFFHCLSSHQLQVQAVHLHWWRRCCMGPSTWTHLSHWGCRISWDKGKVQRDLGYTTNTHAFLSVHQSESESQSRQLPQQFLCAALTVQLLA